jgi:hypothetical protein
MNDFVEILAATWSCIQECVINARSDAILYAVISLLLAIGLFALASWWGVKHHKEWPVGQWFSCCSR